VHALLSIQTFDLQTSNFKMTMVHNSKLILWKDNDLNLINKLSCKVSTSTIFNHKFSKCIKFGKIDDVLVISFVKDQQTFNIVNFMNYNELQNMLNNHLDLHTRFYNQWFFTMQFYSYEHAIAKWQGKLHYYVDV
jgi:hypothetical protein